MGIVCNFIDCICTSGCVDTISFARECISGQTIVGIMEPCLEAVHEEDRPIVRNVISALNILKKTKIFSSWNCTVVKRFYIITAYFVEGEWEIGTKELDLIYDVNPLRVLSVSFQFVNQKHSLKIKISDRDEPIMMTETELVHVRKRTKWLKN